VTQSSLTIPFASGELLLGTWQGIFLFEHRRAPRQRDVINPTLARIPLAS
jgi:thiamine phosphate synthase YjbQ (UPF0047 family)